jgi:hypothetical protein
MSGFTRSPRYGTDVVYELTATKASHWHRSCPCGVTDTAADIATTHAVPAGFTIVRNGGNFVALRGPGIAQEKTGPLCEAISGRSSTGNR